MMLTTAAELLQIANAAMSVAAEAQSRSLEIQQAHAQGKTISDDQLDSHIKATHEKLEALKAL